MRNNTDPRKAARVAVTSKGAAPGLPIPPLQPVIPVK